jgi:vacuolar-type H+-ATPase subunit I/STV1
LPLKLKAAHTRSAERRDYERTPSSGADPNRPRFCYNPAASQVTLEENGPQVHNCAMSEDPRRQLPSSAANGSFEAQVLASLEEIKGRLRDLDERVQKLEAKAYDTKPIWENALKEIADTRVEMREGFANSHAEVRRLARKLTVLHDILLEIRVDYREYDERLQKVEPEPLM